MSKWLRGIVISLAACLLLAGGALAGPNRLGDENGDPDRPEGTLPIDKLEVSVDSVDTARDAKVTARSERTSNEFKILFRVYLKLFRIFLR